MKKVFIFIIFLTTFLYSDELQSNILIDLYSQTKPILQKLQKVDGLKDLKTYLQGGYATKSNVLKDFKKLKEINSKTRIFSNDELIKILEIINKLQIYKRVPIG